ncbi:MAG TPA: translation initiation factor IF-2 N-terminal domain-containing protein, partial [Tepidisphaeraceae bacterium]|nr:translation initiation factor IF-2 N-terminal domain-containing protein [Tepidisphaeraceae bacterium]
PGQTALSVVQRGEPIEIEEPITVKSLAAALGLKVKDILTKLIRQGTFANINSSIDPEVAQVLALDWGIELKIAAARTLEQELEEELSAIESKPENRVARPPVVTILGHVDHGKTSLLDRIRKANVAAGEAGGITQHTAAWMVQLGEGDAAKRVTFIDTPGHEAFTAMRARGANMTDIVVLVVSAAEGVQPQTIESINHARAAEVPIVVAMNKIDRDDANPDMVLGQLAGQGLNPVEWGGDTEVIRTSATTGQGVENLIEILDLQAEVMELKADPTLPARGMVIEARVDPGLGPIATILVQEGTLKVGDVILSGSGYGRVRS